MPVSGAIQQGFRRLAKVAVRGPMTLFARVRHFNVPDLSGRKGGLLIASNHQSFLDPVLVGMGLAEPISYLARRSLFRTPGFRELLRVVSAHPIARGAVDSAALKTVLRLLREGEALLMFPEGTRTFDGSLGTFKSGVAAIAVRCGVPILPVCVEGAYMCWPRSRALPRPGRTAVAYGRLLEPLGKSAEELAAGLRAEVEELQAFLRGYLGHWTS